jgi:hypothetical protein
MLEGGAFLDQVVTDELKVAALRKYSGFVMYRAVFEVEDQMVGDAITVSDLNQVTVREQLALQIAQDEKAMNQTFRVVYGHRFRRESDRLENGCTAQ